VAGATVLSLGCQNLQIEIFKDALNDINPDNQKPIHILDQQEQGTTDTLIKNAIKLSYESLKEANAIERKPAPLSKLTLGLECGGSDGFSGVSANPVLGRVSDMLVALGGRAVLAEFPELCGVEQQLIDRCENTELASRFLQLMQDFERSAIDAGSGFDMNPSPGNIKDGLITDAMKSAGAAKKGGAAPIAGVLDYTEYCHKQGLHLLCTPGNDVESTTALVGSGCNLVTFTTGLGTPTGNPAAPVIKISSNNNLAQKMKDIIDFNAGDIITGKESIEDAADRLLSYMVDVASGRIQTQADKNQQFDFIPWKRGVSL
jgi:altronate hydrolase